MVFRLGGSGGIPAESSCPSPRPQSHRTRGVRECEATYAPDRELSTHVRGFYAMVRDVSEETSGRFAARWNPRAQFLTA
jgi:hypothetical protein